MAQHPISAPTAHPSRLGRRLVQLFAGLMLYGASMGLLIRSQFGNTSWDVLHQGLARQLDVSIGTVVIAVGVVVLLLWLPLREKPGFGTVSNVVVIGIAVDVTLAVAPVAGSLPVRVLLAGAGIVLNAVATAAYIGARLGAGPRDGLMTGLVRRTGGSVRLVRTVIEVGVVATGWLLGGTLGVATVLYALAIGPLVQVFLPRLTVPGGAPGGVSEAAVTLGTSAGPGRKPIGRGQS
ncbi:MAG: YczE/YyaS/YitT family protein [Pseudonocardiaceae bacterium]